MAEIDRSPEAVARRAVDAIRAAELDRRKALAEKTGADVAERTEELTAERDRLAAENARLRDALKFGVDLIEGDSFGSEWKRGCADFRRMARAELGKS
jgi:hypothetical protein